MGGGRAWSAAACGGACLAVQRCRRRSQRRCGVLSGVVGKARSRTGEDRRGRRRPSGRQGLVQRAEKEAGAERQEAGLVEEPPCCGGEGTLARPRAIGERSGLCDERERGVFCEANRCLLREIKPALRGGGREDEKNQIQIREHFLNIFKFVNIFSNHEYFFEIMNVI